MFGRTARIGAALAGLWLGGCIAGGGGGGGDCRDGDEACSAGFACVAVANGTAYACRAACDGPDDCLRDEVCGADGVCVDRPPRVPAVDAERDSTPGDVGVPPDADRPVRLIDAEPPPMDADVVVITPPGACEADRAPASPMLLGVQITGFEDFPLFFEAATADEGGRTILTVEPLTNRDRRPTGMVFVSEPFVVVEGAFESAEMEILVPPGANQLGGELRLRVAFVGAVRGDGTICGALEGRMVQPPVGDVAGSIFAGRRLGDRLGSPFGACDGCLP